MREFSVLLIEMWRATQARRPWHVAPFVDLFYVVLDNLKQL